MKMNNTKASAIVVSLLLICSLSAIVLADTENITVTWVVAADTTITASYPTGEGKIEFSAASGDFINLSASSQTEANAGLRITNDGNTAVSLHMNFTSDFPSGVQDVNMSVEDNTNATFFNWESTNETNNQTVVASLPATGSDTEDFWFWSTGSGVAETAGEDRTLRVNSQNV